MSPTSTSPPALKHIPLSCDSDESGISALHIVLALFPNWELEDGKVEFVRFTEGITNTLLKAVKRRPGYTEEQVDNEAVLLRAYGKGTEVLIDRERETTSHSLLAQNGLAPPLLASFQNGLIYGFLRGQVCNSEDLTQEPVWRGVARSLAHWHAILPIASDGHTAVVQNDVEIPLTKKRSNYSPTLEAMEASTPAIPTPNIWTVMQKWIFAFPASTKAAIKKKDELQKELERTVNELGDQPSLGNEGLIFGHCDLLSGNVIIQLPHACERDSDVENISFIDYEYATPSPAAFDIANHFSEWGGFDCVYEALPTRPVRFAFIQEYISSYASHSELDPNIDYVSRLMEEVDLFRGIPGLYWGIWALVQATISQIDFNYANYAEVRLSEYWAWRAESDGSRARAGKEMPLRERRWADNGTELETTNHTCLS